MAVNKRRFVKNKVSCSCSMPGVWKALSHNQGCVVVYHAPKACAHITGEMERNRHFRTMVRGEYDQAEYTAPLITTGIGKKQSIFGGVDLLSDCLDYVVEEYKPEYIVVTSSCVVGVIGDDTASVCAQAEEKWKIPVLHVDCHGFLDGEYYGGYVEAGKQLIDRFMEKTSKKPNTVVIIGEKDGPKSLAFKDFGVLLETFGIKTFNRFPGYCSIDEMKDIASSSFSLILGGTKKAYASLRELADYMTEQLDIPHFEADYPVGWKATCTWIEKLGAYVGMEDKIEASKSKLYEQFLVGYEPYKKTLQEQNIVFCLGKSYSDIQIDWIVEWLHMGELPLKKVLFLDDVDEMEKDTYARIIKEYYPKVVFEDETDETSLVSQDLVLTTQELAESSLRQLLMPMLPPVGTAGMVQMYKKLFMLARRTEERGVVLYGW